MNPSGLCDLEERLYNEDGERHVQEHAGRRIDRRSLYSSLAGSTEAVHGRRCLVRQGLHLLLDVVDWEVAVHVVDVVEAAEGGNGARVQLDDVGRAIVSQHETSAGTPTGA